MKKGITFFLVLILAFSATVYGQFNTVWERNDRTSSFPSWASAGYERGFAYYDGHIYVASRTGGNFIHVVDAATGEDVTLDTPFDLTIVAGGTYALNDVETSDDGAVFLANLAVDITASPFKVYIWESEGGAPGAVLEYTGTEAHRLGDKFEVTGSWSDGTVTIWAPAAGSNPGVVYKFSTVDQGDNWTTEKVTLTGDYATLQSNTGIAPYEEGFWIAGTGDPVRLYNHDGSYVANTAMTGETSTRNGMEVFEGGGDYWLSVFTGRDLEDAGNASARIGRGVLYKVTDPTAPEIYGVTELQGSADGYSSIHGETEHMMNPSGTATIFVLDGAKGMGAYETTSVVPVEMTVFTAAVTNGYVSLSWKTATETNNLGFEVESSVDQKTWKKLGFVDGFGTTVQPQSYSFTDKAAVSGTVYYRLKQVDNDGSFEYTEAIEVNVEAPVSFELSQNYPNPFNPTTNIRFSIPEASHVKLSVYNIIGEEVSTIVNGFMESGAHSVTFDAAKLNSGLYIYKIEAGSFSDMKKMMLIK